MKFGFIENRYKTIFWTAISERFRSEGHSISWLVQNPIFSPSADNVSVIPLPKKNELFELDTRIPEAFNKVKLSDRFINYFGGDDGHYQHYITEIRLWLDREKPNVVIGESTLFHELLIIEECRARGIPFLHPSMPGYPGGRFSVYANDSKDPLGQSDDVPCDELCLELAEAIRKREKIPDYMVPPSEYDPERIHPIPNSFKNRATILRGYFRGERYNTPAPWHKWLLERQVKRNLRKWQELAAKTATTEGMRYVLYPMQMQPEANLDIWGQEFRDQVNLICEIGDSLQSDWRLLVKANPKAKYEVSTDLLDLLERHPKVSPISLSDPMPNILNRVELVTTVTGTVATECVLSRKPVVQFGPGIVENGSGCARLSVVADIAKVINLIEAGDFAVASDSERIRLVKRLYQTTFPGKVSDPVSSPAVMATDNVRRVASTLLEVAKQCG